MTIYSLAIISALFYFFSLFSKKMQTSICTPPMIFTSLGLILGRDVFNLIDFNLSNQLTRIVAELALILVLFADASRISIRKVIKDHNIPIRLLTIGLLLTFGCGFFVAYQLFPVFSLWEAALLSAILCPTDAALIHHVVSYKKVPMRIRQALNIESGLNDGLMVPIIIGLISYVSVVEKTLSVTEWTSFLFKQISLGVLTGVFVAYVGGKLYGFSYKKQWINKIFQEISAIAIALLAYTLAEILNGNGFIASFIAGITIARIAKPICQSIQEFTAVQGQLVELLLFFFFGLSFVGPVLSQMSIEIFIYSLLSLTLIRIIPVFISLAGCKLRFETKLYLGWFGPRGIASIVFAFLVIEKIPTMQGNLIFTVGCSTILLSIFLHGASTILGSKWYAKKQRHAKAENKLVTELPIRIPHD